MVRTKGQSPVSFSEYLSVKSSRLALPLKMEEWVLLQQTQRHAWHEELHLKLYSRLGNKKTIISRNARNNKGTQGQKKWKRMFILMEKSPDPGLGPLHKSIGNKKLSPQQMGAWRETIWSEGTSTKAFHLSCSLTGQGSPSENQHSKPVLHYRWTDFTLSLWTEDTLSFNMWLNFTHHHYKYYQDSLVLKAAETITKLASSGGSLKMMEYEDRELISSHGHTKTTPIYRMTLQEQPEDYQNNSPTMKYIKEKPHRDGWEVQRHNPVRTHTSSRQHTREEDISDSKVLSMEQGAWASLQEPQPWRLETRKTNPLTGFEDQEGLWPSQLISI